MPNVPAVNGRDNEEFDWSKTAPDDAFVNVSQKIREEVYFHRMEVEA